MTLASIDSVLIVIYGVFVLAIGFLLRRQVVGSVAFVGVFMMPFYCGSRARSVPEYLELPFDEKTRGFNAVTFAASSSWPGAGRRQRQGRESVELFSYSSVATAVGRGRTADIRHVGRQKMAVR